MALQFTARRARWTDVLTQGAGALNIVGGLVLAEAINPSVRRGRNWITHPITAANLDGNGQRAIWSQRLIYGDRFVQPRYAQIHLFRWDDDIAWAYDAIAGDIDWQRDNIVWGNGDNIVWGNADNIVWGNDDNIVWGNREDDNIVWGNTRATTSSGASTTTSCGATPTALSGATPTTTTSWATASCARSGRRTSCGLLGRQHRVGQHHPLDQDNIVWGNNDDNIVWGVLFAGVVWGNDNIVWGNCGDNIVWGNAVLTGGRR